jgi:hypothetical protein
VKFSHVWTRRTKSDDRQVWPTALWSFSPKLSVVMLLLTFLMGSTLRLKSPIRYIWRHRGCSR